MVSDVALYLPWIVFHPDQISIFLTVMGFVLLALLSEFCGVLAQALVGQRRYDGPMGKSDRAFFVGLIALTLWRCPSASSLLPWAFGLGCVLLLQSCMNHLGFLLHSQSERL